MKRRTKRKSKLRRRRRSRRRRSKKRRSKKRKSRKRRRRTKRGGTCITRFDRKPGESIQNCMRRKFKDCKSSKTDLDGNPDHHHITCLERYPNKHPETKKEWQNLIKTWGVEPGKYDDYGKLVKGHKQWHASDSEL